MWITAPFIVYHSLKCTAAYWNMGKPQSKVFFIYLLNFLVCDMYIAENLYAMINFNHIHWANLVLFIIIHLLLIFLTWIYIVSPPSFLTWLEHVCANFPFLGLLGGKISKYCQKHKCAFPFKVILQNILWK